ncbi:hypothetical protein [Desulfocucumis palustris]|nr:hypothetical protein [Desulfocucumis palustris]
MVIIIFICCLIFSPGPAAAGTTAPGRFIIVVLDQIGLEDLSDPSLKNINYLIENGAVALMNNRTGGASIADNTFTTVGAGSRAVGYPAAAQAFNAGDKINSHNVEDIYLRRNEEHNLTPHNILNLNTDQLKTLNSNRHYNVHIGATGDLLNSAGISTAVLGNSDMPPEDSSFPGYIYGRQAVSLLMDGRGVVDYGDISGDLLMADKSAPFGVRTDEKRLLSRFTENYGRCKVIIIDFGDTTRAAVYTGKSNEIISNRHTSAALKRADDFIGRVLRQIDLKRDCLAVLAPTPSQKSISLGNTLTPVILTGNGVNKGLLTSGSTHRKGIVANIDVAPTILGFYNIDKTEAIYGQKITSLPSGNQMEYLRDIENKLVDNTTRRLPMLSAVAYYTLAILIVSLLIFILHLFGVETSDLLKKFLLANYLAIFSLPLALLLLAVPGALTVGQSFIALLLIILLITGLYYPLYRKYNILYYISGISLTFIAILFADLFTGADLIVTSPLGYDPQSGARFYGIGNEFMGAVIGASTLGIATFMDIKKFKGRLLLAGVLMLGILFVLVYPGLGSKAGASISVTAAFVTLIWLLSGYRTGKKQVFIVIIAVLLVIAAISVIDSIGVPRTHVGRAIKEFQAGGWENIYNIIIRKISMNFRLMRYSYWSGMLIVSLLLMLVMFKFKLNFLDSIRRTAPQTLNGCHAGLLGAAVALFTNDAGIVAAATAVIYPVFCMLSLNLLNLKDNK